MNKSDKLFMETAEKQQDIIDTLLEACETAMNTLLNENSINRKDSIFGILTQAISKAKGE